MNEINVTGTICYHWRMHEERPYKGWTDNDLILYLSDLERMVSEGGNGHIHKLLAIVEAEIREREFERED